MNVFEKDYNDIIDSLTKLKEVKPDIAFEKRMQYTVANTMQSSARTVYPFTFVIRFAIIILLLLVAGGSGVVVASANSKPGDFLYPVKQIVDGIKLKFTTKEETEVNVQKNSTNTIQSTTPTVTQAQEQITNTVLSITPTPTTIPLTFQDATNTDIQVQVTTTPLPTQTISSQEPQVNGSIDVKVGQIGGLNVSLDLGKSNISPTPFIPPLVNTDSSSDPSLLPNIQLNITDKKQPLLKLNL